MAGQGMYLANLPFFTAVHPAASSSVPVLRPRSGRKCLRPPRFRPPTRDIDPVWVYPRCGVQTPEQRFGLNARREIYKMLRLLPDEIPPEDQADNDTSSDDNDDNDTVSETSLVVEDPGNVTEIGVDHDDEDDEVVFHVNNSSASSVGAEINGATGPLIPRVARTRMNLTVLSQRYNIYFAVYGDSIYVYRPQPAPEILRGPELILHLPRSRMARMVTGIVYQNTPHYANHAIIGDLGVDEILLLSCDDGDVLAYYTRHIATYLESRHLRCQPTAEPADPAERRRHRRPMMPPRPRPFFHECVGKSAWGLAIHAQSRLIGVSSNLAEITVFAFALKPGAPDDPHRFKTTPLPIGSGSIDRSPATSFGTSALRLESFFRSRDRNWRILLPLDPMGTNVPSIAFVDDAYGNAEMVAAVDINGVTWLLDIWTLGNHPVSVGPPQESRTDGRLTGWGILALPASAFVPSKTMPSGILKQRHTGGKFINITQDMNGMLLNLPPQDPPDVVPADGLVVDADVLSMLGGQTSDEESSADTGDTTDIDDPDSDNPDNPDGPDGPDGLDDPDDQDDTDSPDDGTAAGPATIPGMGPPGTGSGTGSGTATAAGSSHLMRPRRASTSRRWLAIMDFGTVLPMDVVAEYNRNEFKLDMAICPSLGLVYSMLSEEMLVKILNETRFRRENIRAGHLQHVGFRSDLRDIASRVSFFRTFGSSAELFTTSTKKPGVFFSPVLRAPFPPPNPLWDMDASYNRLSLLHVIPEIGLVIVGGMFGRVVLVRLVSTKERTSSSSRCLGRATPRRSFRTEWVLPRSSEELRRPVPFCCLLGMAVSRVPEAGAGPWGLFNSPSSSSPSSSSKSWPPPQDGAAAPRRWRLILHYMDHTILQYYIAETKPGARVDVHRG